MGLQTQGGGRGDEESIADNEVKSVYTGGGQRGWRERKAQPLKKALK